MKRFVSAVLAALVLLSLCACGNPAKMSREELYGEIAEMVEKRKVIPEGYLIFVADDLQQELLAYHDATEQLRAYYADWGMRIAANYDLRYLLFDVEYEPERDQYLFRRLANHYELFSARFGQACLCSVLSCDDKRLLSEDDLVLVIPYGILARKNLCGYKKIEIHVFSSVF